MRRSLPFAILLLTLAGFAQAPAKNHAPAPMQVVLLGTGFPRPDPERAGPSTAVVVGDKVVVGSDDGRLYIIERNIKSTRVAPMAGEY